MTETEDPRMPHLRNIERYATLAMGIVQHLELFHDPLTLLTRHLATMKAEMTEISAKTREMQKREDAIKPRRIDAQANSKSHLGRPTG